MAKSTQEALNKIDFDYPLHFVFDIHRMNPNTKTYNILYSRQVILQQGSLKNGINIYLDQLCWQRQRHRLYVTAEDKMQIKYKFISSITLNNNPGRRIRP